MHRMSGRIALSSRGKPNLICPQNFVYTKNDVQSKYIYWKCIEFCHHQCSAIAKSGIEDNNNVNVSQLRHSHGSKISKLAYKMAENEAKQRAIQNP